MVDLSVVLSAAGIIVTYLGTWVSDRLAKRERAELERLSNQVVCSGKIVAASSVHARALKRFVEMYQDRAHVAFMRLAQKHVPKWVEANREEAERLVVGKGGSVAHHLARQLYTCEELPAAFHEDLLQEPAQRAWIAHVRSTTLHNNAEIEEHILQNLHLFDEVPTKEGVVVNECVMDFFAYSASYRRLVSLWDVGDYTMLITPNRFPKEFTPYFGNLYAEKKRALAMLSYELSMDMGLLEKVRQCCCRCRSRARKQFSKVSP